MKHFDNKYIISGVNHVLYEKRNVVTSMVNRTEQKRTIINQIRIYCMILIGIVN